jgi:chemotaxis protein CheX
LEEIYVSPFIISAKHVFKTMLDIDLLNREPVAKGTRTTTADVTAVMGFTGDRRGTMTVSMSTASALTIYKRLFNEKRSQVTPEIIDAVGELTNIISGQARKGLENQGLHLLAHVPMVFVGKNIELNFITKGMFTTIPFGFTLNGTTEELSLDCIFE